MLALVKRKKIFIPLFLVIIILLVITIFILNRIPYTQTSYMKDGKLMVNNITSDKQFKEMINHMKELQGLGYSNMGFLVKNWEKKYNRRITIKYSIYFFIFMFIILEIYIITRKET